MDDRMNHNLVDLPEGWSMGYEPQADQSFVVLTVKDSEGRVLRSAAIPFTSAPDEFRPRAVKVYESLAKEAHNRVANRKSLLAMVDGEDFV